jgi:putative flippase GtrA
MKNLVVKLYHNSALRYLAVGGISFVIDFSLLYLLHEVLGAAIWISTAVAFLGSFVFNYALQRLFSFRSRSSHGKTLAKYIALVIFNTIATTFIVSFFDHLIDGWEIGKVVATVITTLWNYLIYRYWVFADRRSDGPANTAHIVVGQNVNDPDHTIDHRESE